MTAAGYYDQSYPPSLFGPPALVDPSISALSPSTVSAAAGPLTVQVNGSHFEAGSVIEIDHAGVPTTFVSAARLTTSFDPSVAGTVVFTVRNPNDEESNSVNFVVSA